MFIFLDIDGVMVPAKGWKSPEILMDGFPAFSSKAINVLNSLLSESTTVLLTTSHKANYTIDEWKDIFKKRCINAERIKSLDTNIDNLSRKDEILKWFNGNSISEPFVIVDDDTSLNSLPDFLKGNLVLNSSYIGLTNEHLESIKAVLNKDLKLA